MYRLPIAEHAVLRSLAAHLAALPILPYARVEEFGDWRADIAAGPPADDRSRPVALRKTSFAWAAPHDLPPDAIVASRNYYPPGGAGLGWHTDSARPGWRVYLGRPLGGMPGYLLTEDDVFADTDGIAHAFYVARGSWHAVRAPGERLSVGLLVGEVTASALGLTDA